MQNNLLAHISTKHIWLNPLRCRNCHKCRCIDVCKQQVIGKVGNWWHKHTIIQNASQCTGCKLCISACKHKALGEVEEFDVSILERIKNHR